MDLEKLLYIHYFFMPIIVTFVVLLDSIRKEIDIMSTMELDAHRMELIRNIIETDNLEVLKKMKKYFVRVTKEETKENLTPYTMEELNARIDEAEAEIDAGVPGHTIEELHELMVCKYPWLCK